jgi:release factor glutamine methyltransferase
VFAEDEARLLIEAAGSRAELAELVRRRASGAPLETILGWAEFYGMRITVEPGVFVPRRRTELLVEQAIARAGTHAVIVDLCCGTGAVGLAVLRNVDHGELFSVDIDPVAVRCARANVEPAGGQVLSGDLYEPLPARIRRRVHLLVCNAPYVPTASIGLLPPEARDHEPGIALDGGADGLDIQRAVASRAAEWLRPGGSLLIETSESQAGGTAAAFGAGGLSATVVRSEERDATVVIGAPGPQE